MVLMTMMSTTSMAAGSSPSHHRHGTSSISGGAPLAVVLCDTCRVHCTGSKATAGIPVITHSCVTRGDERRRLVLRKFSLRSILVNELDNDELLRSRHEDVFFLCVFLSLTLSRVAVVPLQTRSE